MEKITEFKKKHNNERAFIVGNGPSLENTPMKLLQNEYTFATNKINKIYSSTSWRPSFYSYTLSPPMSEEHEKNCLDTISLGIPCFISNEYKSKFDEYDNVYFVKTYREVDRNRDCLDDYSPPPEKFGLWSNDITDLVYLYNTSIFPLFQIANYMGFSELYIVGCDLGMDVDFYMIFEEGGDPLTYYLRSPDEYNKYKIYVKYILDANNPIKSLINGVILLTWKQIDILSKFIYDDPHFGEGYDSKVELRKGEDNRMRRAHYIAKERLQEQGVEVYNTTIGGELDIYPRRDIRKILKP